jgi:hypothetical protein
VQACDYLNVKFLLGVLKITVPDDLIGTISQFSPVPSSLNQKPDRAIFERFEPSWKCGRRPINRPFRPSRR